MYLKNITKKMEYMTWPLKLHLLPNSIWINTNEILSCFILFLIMKIQIQIGEEKTIYFELVR